MSNYQRVGKVVHHCNWAAGPFHCRKSYLQGEGSTSTSSISSSTVSQAAAPSLTRKIHLQRVREVEALGGMMWTRAYKQIGFPHGNYLAAARAVLPWSNSSLQVIVKSSSFSVLGFSLQHDLHKLRTTNVQIFFTDWNESQSFSVKMTQTHVTASMSEELHLVPVFVSSFVQ